MIGNVHLVYHSQAKNRLQLPDLEYQSHLRLSTLDIIMKF